MKANLTVSRNEVDNKISIIATDKISGLRAFEVEIEPEQFALAITNLGFQECELKLYNNYNSLGKKPEVD